MTKSIKALEELKDEIIPDYALEYEDDEGYKDWIDELYQTIKQDLKRKEQLEKENQELKEQLKLSNESQETVINTMNLVSQENEKLKQAIDILKK